jgi:hypothetical protein
VNAEYNVMLMPKDDKKRMRSIRITCIKSFRFIVVSRRASRSFDVRRQSVYRSVERRLVWNRTNKNRECKRMPDGIG